MSKEYGRPDLHAENSARHAIAYLRGSPSVVPAEATNSGEGVSPAASAAASGSPPGSAAETEMAVGGRPVGRAPLLAGRSVGVAARSVVARVDDAVPGPRLVVWCLAAAAAAAIVIGIAVAVNRWRRE